ncbi:hypothetical protein DFH06DRAFT_1313952 [Mycena polygramma]|nr:hypothetical protein DFH06DRAFT_1313952 [Mycena polygramma]
MVGTTTLLSMLALAAQFVAASPALVTLPAPPGLGSQTLSASVVGVDSQGRTTYAVNEDETEGSSTVAHITATLVQGADHAMFTLSHTSASETIIVGYDCDLKDGNAICSDVESSQPFTTTVALESDFVLDVAATAAPSSGSGAAPSGSQSGSGSSPSPSTKPNSSHKTSASIVSALVGLALVALA